jgi:hypothetical protein
MDDHKLPKPCTPFGNTYKSLDLDFEGCDDKEIDRLYSLMTYTKPIKTTKSLHNNHITKASCPACRTGIYTTSSDDPILIVINDDKKITFYKNKCLGCDCNWYQVQLPVEGIEPIVPTITKHDGYYTLYTHDTKIDDWPYWIVYPSTKFTKGTIQSKSDDVATYNTQKPESDENKCSTFCIIC